MKKLSILNLSNKKPKTLLSFIAAFAAIGVVTLVLTSAAPSLNGKSIEAESHSSQSNTTTVTDATASNNSYVQFDATPAPPPPPPTGSCTGAANTPGGSDGKGGCFPGPNNTGYRNAPNCQGVTRTNFTGTITSNMTISCKDFPSGEWFGTAANPITNFTCHGCRFYGTSVENALVVIFGDNITFEYSSFEPGVAAPPTPFNKSYQYGISADGGYRSFVNKFTVTNSDFWGFGNAIVIENSTQAKPHVFRDNWIHDGAEDGGSYHTDGIGSLSGSSNGAYAVIDHNTIESVGNTNALAFQQGTYNNFSVTNNLFGGFGYTIAIWAPAPSTVFTGNTFSTRLPVLFGPLYPQSFWESNGSVWKCNKWAVPSGAAYGNPAHNGWYWMPNNNGGVMTSDAPFVSQTDHQGNTVCP